MSIIHDALKKSGGDKAKNPSVKPQVERHARSGTNWGPLFVIAVVFLVAGPLLAPIFFKSQEGSHETAVSGQFAVETMALPAAGQSGFQPFKPNPARSNGFTLSGVIYAGEDSYCLINGIVLKKGARVGNATVSEIASDRVVLDQGGRHFTLSVSE
jgi:hypothetical protein